jgi:predicted secreted acid phosphatase
MLWIKYIKLLVTFLFCLLLLTTSSVEAAKNRRNRKKKDAKKLSRQQVEQNFHEVDAFGDDFVDFGAQIGEKGSFSWHADFPLE